MLGDYRQWKRKMKEITWKAAINKVLLEANTPLHYTEITGCIISEGLKTNFGATPSATVNAQIASSIKHQGEKSPYIRVGKGIFAMRNPSGISQNNSVSHSKNSITEDFEEEQYDVVTSFGMFWKRDNIKWDASPNLLGMQQIGTQPVNFYRQLGIYLLYDGREVIYVGRSTDRPLGKRLFEHTKDRLSARWDRFSWFGLLPVSEQGKIGTMPETFSSSKLIPALEAILIEALEPRQNRKRGDDLAAVEYIQFIDPNIEKEKMIATLQKM